MANRELDTWLNEVEVYPDTHPRNPQTLDGRDPMRRLISADVTQRGKDREAESAQKDEEAKRDWAMRREDAERALGEFLGYQMFPPEEKEAEFKGVYTAAQNDGSRWVFEIHVADYVFKLQRTDGFPLDSTRTPGEYDIYVTTSFEQKYMPGDWEWHKIERPAEITDLERAQKLGRRK